MSMSGSWDATLIRRRAAQTAHSVTLTCGSGSEGRKRTYLGVVWEQAGLQTTQLDRCKPRGLRAVNSFMIKGSDSQQTAKELRKRGLGLGGKRA